MVYEGCVISHGGRIRTNNEDNAYLNGVYRKDDTVFEWEASCSTENNILAAVFDGMGGGADGEIASRMAAEAMCLQADGCFSDIADKYTVETSAQVASYHSRRDMGTTFVAVSIEENRYHFFNVGDSKGYLFRDGSLQQLTRDHNLPESLYYTGLLTRTQADRHPERNTLSQYLGLKLEDEVVQPECYRSKPVAGRTGDICLLCSDGLTGLVTGEQIARILGEKHSLAGKAKQLLEEAMSAGGRDNVTIILLESM